MVKMVKQSEGKKLFLQRNKTHSWLLKRNDRNCKLTELYRRQKDNYQSRAH